MTALAFQIAMAAGILTLVIAACMIPLTIRRMKARGADGAVESRDARDRDFRIGVFSAGAGMFLVGLIVAGWRLDFPGGSAPANAFMVTLVSHRWWWEVRYPHGGAGERVTVANELRLPAGRPVRLELSSNDVVHSFWLPGVHGKRDVIPGHATTASFVIAKPGTYIGLCADDCGAQHAQMQLLVIAEPPERFAQWLSSKQKGPEGEW